MPLHPAIDDPDPDARRLVITRIIGAPRELVWQMFADPFHLVRWWGPAGFTNPVCQLDFREGGRWHHVMRGPDGRDYPADSVFSEIVPPARIVYRNARLADAVFEGNPPPSFVRVITFDDLGTGTRLTITAYFDSVDEKAAVVRRGFREGVNESFDKLEALIAGGATT